MAPIALLSFFLLAGVSTDAQSPPLTAEAIMARVAANQDRSNELRSQYIYHQHIHLVSQKANGTQMHEESAEYLVMPTPSGSKKDLQLLKGHYRHKGRYLEFQGDPAPDQDALDGDLVHDMREDLANDKSKDGLASDLFPLTTEAQKKYEFKLLGQETEQGRTVYRLSFRPKDKSDIDWAGEAFIDAAEFEPVRVFTKLSRPIPFLIRKFLVDLPGVGFNVEYRRQPDGVWFPSSFGTEFRFRVLMFLSRNISVSLENSDFERTSVQSRITGYDAPP
jgi:hypothetical protein